MRMPKTPPTLHSRSILPQVPDRKQKGRVVGGTENPEYRMLEAAKQAMQVGGRAGLGRGVVLWVPCIELWFDWCLHTAWPATWRESRGMEQQSAMSSVHLGPALLRPSPAAAQPRSAGRGAEGGPQRSRWAIRQPQQILTSAAARNCALGFIVHPAWLCSPIRCPRIDGMSYLPTVRPHQSRRHTACSTSGCCWCS